MKPQDTCQFIQHFRKQLLAGGVKNEELLESGRRVPRVSTHGRGWGGEGALPSAQC